jgi:hypothetical protein
MAAVHKHETRVRTARMLVPAIMSPTQEPILPAVQAFGPVLDWMEGCQQ